METRKLTMIAFSVSQNDDQFPGPGVGGRGGTLGSTVLFFHIGNGLAEPT